MPRRHSVFVGPVLLFLVALYWTYSGYTDLSRLPTPGNAIWYGKHPSANAIVEEKVAVHPPGFTSTPVRHHEYAAAVPTPPPFKAPAPAPEIRYETIYALAPPRQLEPIVMTFVTIGAANAKEGSVAIKSALMHSSRPLQFHIICSEDAKAIHESRFSLFTRPAYPVEVFYYTISGQEEARGPSQDWLQLQSSRENFHSRTPH